MGTSAPLPLFTNRHMVNTVTARVIQKAHVSWNLLLPTALVVDNIWVKMRNSTSSHYARVATLHRSTTYSIVSSLAVSFLIIKILLAKSFSKTSFVVCNLALHLPCAKKCRFIPSIRACKLKDAVKANHFHEALQNHGMSTAQSNNDTTHHFECVGSRLNFPTLKAADEVCCLSKNRKWRPETWRWTEQIDDVLQEKRARFKIYNSLMKIGKTTDALILWQVAR